LLKELAMATLAIAGSKCYDKSKIIDVSCNLQQAHIPMLQVYNHADYFGVYGPYESVWECSIT